MNKIYKIIWSKAKNCYVVVSEIAKRNGKCSSSLNKKIIASFLAAGLLTALPMSVEAAIKIGNPNTTTSGASSGVVWGTGTVTDSGYRGTAFGESTKAYSNNATAFGYKTNARQHNATAFGKETYADSRQSTAFGSNTYAGTVLTYMGEVVTPVRRIIKRDINSTGIEEDFVPKEAWVLVKTDGTFVATGVRFDGDYDAEGNITYSLNYQTMMANLGKTSAIGDAQQNATAFGEYSIATGQDATAFGYRTAATAWSATAWGHETAALGKRSTAFGIETWASGNNATAFGYRTEATNENATAWGSNTKATGIGSTAFGTHTKSGGDNSITWGKNSEVGSGSLTYKGTTYTDISIQLKTEEISDPSGSGQIVQIGRYYVQGRNAAGELVTITDVDNAGNPWEWNYNGDTDQKQRDNVKKWITDNGGTLAGDYSTAFGDSSKVDAENALGALGGTVNIGANNSAAIGKEAVVSSTNAYAMGNKATIGTDSTGSVALGGQEGTETKIGNNAANAFAAVGGKVEDNATSAIAIGESSEARVPNSVALGSGSRADRAPAMESGYDVSTGKSYEGDGKDDYKWKSTAAAVSVGGGTIDGKTVTRQITGVAAGYEDTDAVNVAQLKAAGFQFGANVGGTDDPSKNTRINRMGSTVNVVGSDPKAGHTYSADNLTTEITQDTAGNSTITVKLDENPTFKGIQINNGPSTVTLSNSNNSLRVGDKYGGPISITNVAAGTADTDAVNVSQLKASRTKITDGKNVTVEEYFDKEKDSYSYKVNAYDTKVEAGDGVTVSGKLDTKTNVRTYTVAVNRSADSQESGGVISGGETNKYWDSKQTQDAVNKAYWIARAGDTEMHVSAGTLVGFEGKNGSGITVENVDGIFTFDTKPLTFAGDMGVDVGRKLGETVKVVGGAQNLTDNNIGVVADGSNTLTVKLAKDVNLTKEGSLTIGNSVMNNEGVTATTVTAGTGANQTVIGNSGVQVGGNTYINNAGINANNKKITNVAPGTAGTDAVNLNQLNDVKWNIGTGAVNGGTNKHGGPLDLSPVGKQDGIDRSNIRFNAGAGVDISYSTILTGTSKDDKEIGYNIDISAKFEDATISFDGSGHYIQAITYDGQKYLLAGGGTGTAAPTDVISDNRAVTAELLEHYNEDIKGYEYAIEVASPFMNLNGLKDEKGKPAEIHTDDFAKAKGESAIAIGRRAEAEADNSLAVGHNADAKAENATAIGMNSHAHAENSVSIGVAASSSGNRAIVIGTTASYDSSREDPADATLPHQGSRASGQGSVVLGDHARAQSNIYTIEIAENPHLIGTPDHLTNDAIAIGTKAEVRATNAIALGGSMSYTDENGVTKYGETNGRYVGAIVGDSAKSGIAIGGAYGEQGENGEIKQEISAAATYGLRGIAIGTGATVANKDDFTALENVLSDPEYQKAKGDFQKARAEYLDKLGAYDAIKDVPLNDPTVPSGMQITQEDKDRAEYQMNQAKAALEKATQTYSLELKKSIRLQEKDAIEESDAIAIGTKAVAQVKESIALGSNSVTTAKDRAGSRTGLSGYDPLQQDSDNDYFRGDEKYKEDDPVWRSTAGSLSVGGGTTTVKDVYGNEKEVTVTRRISNVAAGIEDSDAVNVAQLKRATSLKTDSRNTSIGLDKDGNMVVNSPYLNIQGVKTSSDYTTIINRFGTPEEYIQSLEDQKTEINSRIDSINVSREMIKDSLQKLEEDYKAQKITEAAYLAQKADYEEQWDATGRRLDDLAASLKEKDTEIANAPTHYQEAKEYYDSQANASGTDSIAVGNKSAAGGKESVSIGANNTIGTPGELNAAPDAELEKAGQQSIAVGSGNTVMGKQSIAIGTNNTVTGDRSGAIGDPSIIDATDSYSVGNDNKIAAGQNDVFALGNQVTTTTSNSVFLGSKSAYVADGKTTAGMSEYSSATINGRTYNYAGGKPAGVVSVGDVGQERRIQNVAAGKVSPDSTDAINGSQLYSALDNSFTNLGDQISNVDNRAKKGIAGAAALAALHPMEFDPDDKLTFAAGMGHYRGETAAALGMFYRPDEKVMFSLGGTVGNGENMVNAGVSFSLDRTPRVTGSRTAMAKEIVQLREQVAQLTALVNQIAANQGMTMPVAPTIFPDTPENHYAYACIDQLQKQGYITGYAGRTLTRDEFAAAFDRAMAGGATLDKRIVKEFEPELSHVRVAHVEGNGNEEGKWYERPRFSYDKVEKHEIPMKHFRVQKNNNNK